MRIDNLLDTYYYKDRKGAADRRLDPKLLRYKK